MKKIFTILFLIVLSFSCSSNKETANLSDLPEWVINPGFDGKVAGIGIAGKSHGGFAVQRPIAMTRAKGDLAARIQSKVSQLSKVALQQAKTNNLGDDFISTFEEATTVLVKELPMSGASSVNIKEINGQLYVRVALDGKDYSKYISDIQAAMEKKISKSTKAQSSISKALNATKDLFKELKK